MGQHEQQVIEYAKRITDSAFMLAWVYAAELGRTRTFNCYYIACREHGFGVLESTKKALVEAKRLGIATEGVN